jgi:hypothetical protein
LILEGGTETSVKDYHSTLHNIPEERRYYADDVNMLGGSVRTMKKNTEAFVVANKEIGLEVNAEVKN